MNWGQKKLFLLRRPTADDIHHYLLEQRSESFSYPDVGASERDECPSGFSWDTYTVELGNGEAVFERACAAIVDWQMMPHPMTSVYWPVGPQVGVEVIVGFNLGPIRTLNPCRVVYVVDEEVAGVRRFGFGYGTLPGHAESGEERFLVIHDLARGNVHYQVCSFSRPKHILARVAKPLARYLQAKFRRLSAEQMISAVAGEPVADAPSKACDELQAASVTA